MWEDVGAYLRGMNDWTEGHISRGGEKGGGRGEGGESISEATKPGNSILFLLKVFSRDVVKISTDMHRIPAPSTLPLDAEKAVVPVRL